MAHGVPYLEHLRALPFVEEARLEPPPADEPQPDANLYIRTPHDAFQLHVELKRTHLSRELAWRVLDHVGRDARRWILLAPSIGSELGDLFTERGLNFVDSRGNCYLNLHDQFVARIQGRRQTVRRRRGMRAPSYQVLFALLCDPALGRRTIRDIAEEAGVSRQPVSDMLHRLVEDGHMVRGSRGHSWTSDGYRRGMDLWLAGYESVVRPKLLAGTFRLPDPAPRAVEEAVRTHLADLEWRWGGTAAAHRLVGHYRGDRTVVHVRDADSRTARRLGAVPAPDGPLILMGVPGPIALRGRTPDTVQPLLVYSELLTSDDPRARDQARLLWDELLEGRP
ncbi:MAG: type IV toxin-antitoxin system AbiEi family antitoxin [Myxococcota bacterium]